ncbi:NAD-dependent epimerase/dehydratase family protein [Mesorhizobium sp. L-8-3]|uniref:NAD-dependent epimerase/dehydratase family protein n=1 Tax=Mesorhizobium sp. L-8-3 TaxID=2744522 RepID=UPI00192566FA|nr:NAD(P)-dependent oxidoreductase [Mesorhizobium sp. L-8-3]
MRRPATLVSGGTGLVGRFIVEHLAAAGHDVIVLGRTSPPKGFFSNPVRFLEGALDPDRDQFQAFDGMDFFVHAAFDHLPGKYRGGEGGDPDGFWRRNHEGSVALFDAARRAGVARTIFLSSRAAYGGEAPGAPLHEDLACAPDTLYGKAKLAAESALGRLTTPEFATASLRITGVYGPAGPGREHKWSALLGDYLAGKPIEPRAGTEVHGEDVAAAVELMLTVAAKTMSGKLFNVSDIVVDRHDLLAIVKERTGSPHALPVRADASSLGVMATDRLQALGWRPGGHRLLRETVVGLVTEHERLVLLQGP